MALGFDEPIRGVNLGNWLVLERWMTPGLFRTSGEADEIWMHRTMPSDALDRLLRRHREIYVTLDDFRAIAAHGCNLVRIPVPYFIFGDVPGHPGCVGFLDRAFDWANATGLKVLIDLHTVPGSQNGYDNGGLTGVCRWHRSPKAVGFALDVLTRLAARYRDDPALFGIEVLNEPVSWLVYRTASSTGAARDAAEAHGSGHVPMRFLKAFYRESYRRLRGVLRPQTVVVFHDVGLHRAALYRRLLNGAHVAQAAHGHAQCARNGRGRKRQHIHAQKRLFQLFLVLYAKALFFVHNDKAKVFEFHILLQKAVCAHNKVYRAVRKAAQGGAHLLLRGKAG